MPLTIGDQSAVLATEHLLTALQRVQDAVFLTDRDSRIVVWNHAAEALFGWPASEALGARADALIAGMRRFGGAENDDVRSALNEWDSWSSELIRANRTGRLVVIALSLEALRDAAGARLGTAAVCREITAHALDASVRETQARQQEVIAELGLRAVAAATVDELLHLAAQRVAQTLDTDLCGILELSPRGDMLRVRAGIGWAADTAEWMAVPDDEAAAEQPENPTHAAVEQRMLASDLLRRHGAVSGTSAPIGDPTNPFGILGAYSRHQRVFAPHDHAFLQAVAGLLAETLARARAEHERTLLAAIIASANEAVIGRDLGGKIIDWNPAAERLYGYRAAEAIGRRLLEIFPPERAVEELALLRGAAERGQSMGPFETERVTKDGRRIIVELSVSPIRDLSGAVVGVSTIARDVTAEKQAERLGQEKANLAALLAVTKTIVSASDVASALGVLLDRIVNLAPFTGALIFTIAEGDVAALIQRGAHSDQLVAMASARIEQDAGATEPLVIADSLAEAESGRALQGASAPQPRSWLYYPIASRARLSGGVLLAHLEPGAFSHDHVTQLSALAHAIDLAIEHQRVLEHMRAAATQQERRRIARELHDVVTQTLFTISVVAEVLPRLWERDRDAALRSLGELRDLARGALAEMRTLLLELRPEALERARLSDLLVQLAEAVSVRLPAPVAVTIDDIPELPPPVKTALYRIAQQALNNVAKHAEAAEATVHLHCDPGGLTLTVRDDGIGFDVEQVSSDHLGLRMMRERAEEIGARLAIRSGYHHGTEVTLAWATDACAGEDEAV
jgi:two-component system nitrate/nitrite sensor histidine kinase NarX